MSVTLNVSALKRRESTSDPWQVTVVKSDAILDAGNITYDGTETYTAGTVGQELSSQRNTLNQFDQNMAYVESGDTASRTYSALDFISWKGTLYKANQAIPATTAFSTGTGGNLTLIAGNSNGGGLNALIIQNGSSGDVQWIRFPDGTQVVYGTWTAPANEQYIRIDFPVSFELNPLVFGWGNLSFKTFRAPSTQKDYAVLVEASGAQSTAYGFNFIAIGRWF